MLYCELPTTYKKTTLFVEVGGLLASLNRLIDLGSASALDTCTESSDKKYPPSKLPSIII